MCRFALLAQIRTLAITVLWGLTASAGAAPAAPDPTALSGSIDKAAPKKANERDPALVAKAIGSNPLWSTKKSAQIDVIS